MTNNNVDLPKNYKEDSILEFFGSKNKIRWYKDCLMFMLNPDPDETFTPTTTYIPGDLKRNQWLYENMIYNDQEFMLEVCTILSHEAIHLTLARSVGRKECDKFDPIFGESLQDDYIDINGLLGFKFVFKPRKNKLKGWGKNGR